MLLTDSEIKTLYFDGIKEEQDINYLNETNINIDQDRISTGKINLIASNGINLNASIKAENDINIKGEVHNANNAIIYSKQNITIENDSTFSFTGMIYAPNGTVTIKSNNVNFNVNNYVINGTTHQILSEYQLFLADMNNDGEVKTSDLLLMKRIFAGLAPDSTYIPYDKWDTLEDSDGDGIPDSVESYYGTNRYIKDTDNDGLLDFDEINWNGIDERYKNLNATRKDTIEKLFPELSNENCTKSSNKAYIQVNDNDININLNVCLNNDIPQYSEDMFRMPFESDYDYKENMDECNNIINRLGNNFDFKDIIIDSLKTRWNGTYYGTEYDFYPGMVINFELNINFEENSSLFGSKIKLFINDDYGRSFVNKGIGGIWSNSSTKQIHLYTGTSYGTKSIIATFEGEIAHEFGHVMGLGDTYGYYEDKDNPYQPISQNEINYDYKYIGLPKAKEVMAYNGVALTNDIEMILSAFEENRCQFFVPYSNMLFTRNISQAIKEFQIYEYKGDNIELQEKYYIWDCEIGGFKEYCD